MNNKSGFIKNFFLIIIVIFTVAFAALPVVSQTAKSYSDSYIVAQMHIIQSEMILKALDPSEATEFDCLRGEIDYAVVEIVREANHGVLCRVDTKTSEMVAFTELSTGSLYCVDSNGGRLHVEEDPEKGYYCH